MSDRDLMLLRAQMKRQRRAKRFARNMMLSQLGSLREEMRLLSDGYRRSTQRIIPAAIDAYIIDSDGSRTKLEGVASFTTPEHELAYRAKHGLIG